MSVIIINLIKIYQYLISPIFPPNCRYLPTCSSYACEAFAKYGVLKGFWLTVKRLSRCNPWNSGGYDPLP